MNIRVFVFLLQNRSFKLPMIFDENMKILHFWKLQKPKAMTQANAGTTFVHDFRGWWKIQILFLNSIKRVQEKNG